MYVTAREVMGLVMAWYSQEIFWLQQTGIEPDLLTFYRAERAQCAKELLSLDRVPDERLPDVVERYRMIYQQLTSDQEMLRLLEAE